MTTDVPRDGHKRHAGRAAPGRARPPGQELPSAGTGELNQIAASATLSQVRHLPQSRAAGGLHRYPNTAFDQPRFI